jgi:hypothetical protein
MIVIWAMGDAQQDQWHWCRAHGAIGCLCIRSGLCLFCQLRTVLISSCSAKAKLLAVAHLSASFRTSAPFWRGSRCGAGYAETSPAPALLFTIATSRCNPLTTDYID